VSSHRLHYFFASLRTQLIAKVAIKYIMVQTNGHLVLYSSLLCNSSLKRVKIIPEILFYKILIKRITAGCNLQNTSWDECSTMKRFKHIFFYFI